MRWSGSYTLRPSATVVAGVVAPPPPPPQPAATSAPPPSSSTAEAATAGTRVVALRARGMPPVCQPPYAAGATRATPARWLASATAAATAGTSFLLNTDGTT